VRQLFTVAEILEVTGGRLLQGSPATPVTGFAYDSRQVKPGDCFVAMPGERVDGHDYADKAAAAGAACIIAGRHVEVPGAALVEVPDPLLALGHLGRVHRERFPIPIIGITGSVGKTTTKELVAAALGARFNVFRSIGNLNSEVGLPITLMDLDTPHQAAVLEMGMRAPGEIEYLVSIARPDIGIVTNVGPTHLELLGTIENIARAKSELVRGLPVDGAAILNADDPLVAAMAGECSCRTVWYYGFGARGRGDRWVTVQDLERSGETGQRITLVSPDGEAEAFLPAPGRHNVLNAMAAAAAGLHMGMSLAEVARGLADYVPSGNRMRILNVGGVRLLDDTYNAAPVSVIAALGVMRDLAGEGRCIALLGDMYELGAAAYEGHVQVGEAAGRLADLVVAVGDMARHIAAAAGSKGQFIAAKPAALDAVKQMVRPGDTLLVKGSRGMAMEEIVQALEKHLAV
jgi:UDP-N-acetylmuramoyl-tripeptide--D-alanyl-D-alanine ligase